MSYYKNDIAPRREAISRKRLTDRGTRTESVVWVLMEPTRDSGIVVK